MANLDQAPDALKLQLQIHAALKPGEVLAGKYRVERVLGAGGMGVVVAAHHLQLDEKVALKFLLPQALGDAASVARFLQEARAAAKVKSEHVARVIDVGQLENGAPYMVMEYLDGTDLAGWLKERGALRVEQAVDFVLQACEALADAHVLGIVHRDLKPANLFCIQRSDGQLSIKVLDFGISKVTTPGAAGHDMTRTSTLMGSPLYMSPEQMKLTKGVDARTDIWSLGIILFELITGRPPFNAEAVTELAIKVATEPAPSLRELRRDAPPGLENVVETCLQKDRAKRFQTVAELAVALRDFGTRDARISVERVLGTLRKAGAPEALPPPATTRPPPESSSVAAVPLPAPATGATWGRTASGTSSGTKTFVGIAAGAVLLGIVALVALPAGLRFLHKPEPAVATSVPSTTSVATPAEEAVRRASTTTAPAAAPAAAPPPPAPSAPQVGSPVSAASLASLASPAVSASAPKTVVRPATPAARPARPPQPSPAPSPPSQSQSAAPSAAKPSCNPPYVIDAAGDRQYKPECL